MSVVCSQRLRHIWQTVTDLGFVFTTTLHSKTLGGQISQSVNFYIMLLYCGIDSFWKQLVTRNTVVLITLIVIWYSYGEKNIIFLGYLTYLTL